MTADIADACVRAIEYLESLQAIDGSFADYALPVGISDQWVTAYVGLALAEAGDRGRAAADRAARWLETHRADERGWGYNAATRPDADSTAHACSLLAATGRAVPEAALAWLETLWRADGGFATYDDGDAWAQGHPCVTPPVYTALHRAGRRALAGDVRAYLARMQRADGSWPAYWWRGHHYAEFVTVRLLAELGEHEWIHVRAAAERRHDFRSALELACVVGSESVRTADADAVAALHGVLVGHQRPDGSWPPGYDLRVTAPDCRAPWEAPAGEYYCDLRSTITTATSLRALHAA